MRELTYHQRIVNLLASKVRGWTDFKEIHQTVAPYIDEIAADREYRKRHPLWHKDEEEDRIAAGRKRLVILSLITLNHHRKMIEVVGDDHDTKKYRLTQDALKKHRAKTKA